MSSPSASPCTEGTFHRGLKQATSSLDSLPHKLRRYRSLPLPARSSQTTWELEQGPDTGKSLLLAVTAPQFPGAKVVQKRKTPTTKAREQNLELQDDTPRNLQSTASPNNSPADRAGSRENVVLQLSTVLGF